MLVQVVLFSLASRSIIPLTVCITEYMKPDAETYNWVIQAYTRAESYDR